MTSADPSVKALLGGTGGDLNEVRGAHQSESLFFSKELTWELMGSPPQHMPGTLLDHPLLDHPAPALTQLKPSRQEGSFLCFTPVAFLRPRIPSFSLHWTNPSLQPLRMALSSESPSTPLAVPSACPCLSPSSWRRSVFLGLPLPLSTRL